MQNVILIAFYGIPLEAIFIIHIFTYKLYKNSNNSLMRIMKTQKRHFYTKEKEGWSKSGVKKFHAGTVFEELS